MSFFREFIAGGIGGSCGVIVGAPFDIVKVRMQMPSAAQHNAISCLKTIVSREGVRALWKGSIPACVGQFPVGALQFAVHGSAQRHLTQVYDRATGTRSEPSARPYFGVVYVSGCVAGFVQCYALVPYDLLKCKLQAPLDALTSKPRYDGILDCARKTWRVEGARGFFQGLGATQLRETPSFGLYFVAYEVAKDRLIAYSGGRLNADSAAVQLLAGGCAGSSAWATIYPFDIVKTRIQSLPEGAPAAEKKTMFQMRAIVARGGVRALFRGFWPCVLRAFPCNAAVFYMYEQTNALMTASMAASQYQDL